MEDTASEQQASARTAPFVRWDTFKTFVKDLKAKAVPPKIDNSLFSGKSGTDSRLLRHALRFYGLVQGPNAETTDRLRSVVAAYGTDEWKAGVVGLLQSYEPILRGVNLTEGTQKDLDDAFRARGDVSGSTLKKAVRLYRAMANEAGMKLSPHFTPLRGIGDSTEASPAAASNNGTSAKPKSKRKGRPTSQSDSRTAESAPEGVDVIQPLPGRDFRVWIPRDLSNEELAFAMDTVRRYLKLTRGKET